MTTEQDVTTLVETLAELRRQNALIQKSNKDALDAERERRNNEEVARAKREWIVEEAAKLEKCEGLPATSMRTWLRGMKNAIKRTPRVTLPAGSEGDLETVQAGVDRDLGRKLMARTARGDLVTAIDKYHVMHAACTITESLAAMEAMFLGADEKAALQSELEEFRQPAGNKPENQIPAYCRHFLQKAEEAYGIIDLAPETDAKLAELFVTSLYSEDVAKEIFESDPPLVTLEDVQNRAVEIFNRSRRMVRAWKGRRRAVPTPRRETPMEIGPIEPNTVEMLTRRVAQLEAKLAAKHQAAAKYLSSAAVPDKSKRQSSSRFTGPRTAGPKTLCYECRKAGHFGRDCEQRKARLARETASADSE